MPNKKRSIVAVDTDGSMAGCFDSIKALHEQYHLTKHHIVNSCKTGKLYRGVRWMYEEEYHQLWLEGRTTELAYERPEWQKPMQRGDEKFRFAKANPTSLHIYLKCLSKYFDKSKTLAEIEEEIIKMKQSDEETRHQQAQ